jgi:hypothetical protein
MSWERTLSLAAPEPGESAPLARANNFPDVAGRACLAPGRLVSARLARPTSNHRYNSIDVRSFVQNRPSNSFIFSNLQKSAHLIESNHFQVPCTQTHAHSFPGSPALSPFYVKRTGGVYPSKSSPLFSSGYGHAFRAKTQNPERSPRRAENFDHIPLARLESLTDFAPAAQRRKRAPQVYDNSMFDGTRDRTDIPMRAAFLVFVAAAMICAEWMWERPTATVYAANAVAQAANPAPLASAPMSPQKASGGSVSAIEKSCNEILARDKTSAPDDTFGRDDPEGGSPGAWQRFQSPADLQKVATNASFEDQAWVWKSNGNIVHARITLPTEGWTTVADYCFQADGTIGFVTSDVDNFTVNEIKRGEWMFDSRGRIQNMKEQFLDLDTGKPKKPERDFIDVDTTIYFSVATLPFASLLQKPGGSE